MDLAAGLLVFVAIIALRQVVATVAADYFPLRARRVPPIGSSLLVAVAVWTASIIVILGLLEPTGGSGPVQYASGSPSAMFVFYLRSFTFMALLAVIPVAVVFGLLGLRAANGKFRWGWAAAAIASYIATWVLIATNPWFLPTV